MSPRVSAKRILEALVEFSKNNSKEEFKKYEKQLEVKAKYCEEHRHLEDKGNEYIHSKNGRNPKFYGLCKRCCQIYERNLNQKEMENYNSILNRPFTI